MTENVAICDLPPDDRQEILMVHACENNRELKVLIAPINVMPDGRKLGEFKELIREEGKMEGRMVVTEW